MGYYLGSLQNLQNMSYCLEVNHEPSLFYIKNKITEPNKSYPILEVLTISIHHSSQLDYADVALPKTTDGLGLHPQIEKTR